MLGSHVRKARVAGQLGRPVSREVLAGPAIEFREI
jgi:hypothetical protein